MPDAPGIDAHQARLHARMARQDREDAVRLALAELAPEPVAYDLPYAEVLRRLADAIAAELRTLEPEKGAEDGTV